MAASAAYSATPVSSALMFNQANTSSALIPLVAFLMSKMSWIVKNAFAVEMLKWIIIVGPVVCLFLI